MRLLAHSLSHAQLGDLPMESVHPLLVHFPIALLMSGVLLDGLALVLRRPGIHRIALWNLALGTLGAAAAVWSGYRAAEITKHSFEIHQVMEVHRKFGIATLLLGATVTGWRLLTRDRLPMRGRLVLLLLSLVMLGTLSLGAHLGGRLVYGFGVGGSFGKPQPMPLEEQEHPHDVH